VIKFSYERVIRDVWLNIIFYTAPLINENNFIVQKIKVLFIIFEKVYLPKETLYVTELTNIKIDMDVRHRTILLKNANHLIKTCTMCSFLLPIKTSIHLFFCNNQSQSTPNWIFLNPSTFFFSSFFAKLSLLIFHIYDTLKVCLDNQHAKRHTKPISWSIWVTIIKEQ